MENNIYCVLFLIALSGIFYSVPLIWIQDINPATACISRGVALIIILVYAFYIKNYTINDINNNNIVVKMIATGICYGLGLICYIEAVKYNKPTLLNLQTIFIFVLTTV